MKSQYVVPANKPRKTTKHDNIALWKERIAMAEKSIAKYQRLIDEAMRPNWESIDTSTT